MNDYTGFTFYEYDGPVANPLPCNGERMCKTEIQSQFGPVPNPSNTQKPLNPKVLSNQITKRPILSPLPPHLLPPAHTQIKPRCFTCKHFEMCQYKKDYLKTIQLIQHTLGAPCHNEELTQKYITIPDFIGFPLMNQEKYFPEIAKFKNDDHEGKLFLSKFNGINYINIIYLIKNQYILIQLKYSKQSELYELISCKEPFYDITYELSEKTLDKIQEGLIDWREIAINAKKPPPPPKKDIINTTHFSALLECDMYDWTGCSFEDEIKKLIKKYPHGVPIDEHGRSLYHIATYHIEDGEVPYAPLLFKDKTECTPQYIAPQPPKKNTYSPKRRGDL